MDDDYGDHLESDAALAALEAAERAHALSAPSSSTSAPVPAKPQTKAVQQPVPQKVARGGSSAIIVNTRQKGNPILTYVKNVPWEYGDVVPDYVVGQTTCALFLSLKYHRLHPEYIYNRIKLLGSTYNLRVLLCMVDIENHTDSLRELSKTTLINNLTLILAWSAPEAGRYLESYKSFEHTPPTIIQEKQSSDYTTRLVEVLTQIRSVNKVDAVSLVSTFGSVRAAVNASADEIVMISGWGQRKVERFEKAVREGFRVGKTKAVKSGGPEARRRKGGPSAGVAAKLGIGPAVMAPSAGASEREAWAIEDDEEALAAVAEMEAEEERRRGRGKGKGVDRPQEEPDAEVGAGIMVALAKMREKAG